MKIYSSLLLIAILVSCNNQNVVKTNTAGNNEQATTAKQNSPEKGCAAFFWFRKGAVLEYQVKDAAGKIIATTQTTIDDVQEEGTATIARYTTLYNNDKGIKSEYKCEGGKIYMNMKSLFNNNFGGLTKSGIEMEISDDFISFPWAMKKGDQLEGASFEIKAKRSGKDFMTIHSTIKDRKVEGSEEIITPAGTWECIKLTETRSTITEMMGKQISAKDMRSTQWYAPGAGLIKTVSYDEKGQVQDETQLISLK